MNKPSKQTISKLKSVLEQLEVMARLDRIFDPGELSTPMQYVREALGQLTEDNKLPCCAPGCHVRKPTARALAGHRAHCHYVYRQGGQPS